MSHNIRYEVYSENVNRKKVQADWDNYVRHEDWQEGASGLPGQIRWIENEILGSEEEAKAYINEHDNGWYDQIAVRFKEIKIVKSKKYEELSKKLTELRTEYGNRNSVCYATTVKSEFVGCKSCGSKLASKYIQNTNKCPLCKSDLRSPTTLSSLERLNERIKVIEKLLREEKQRLEKKQEKSAVIKWLVKIEYHT